METLVRNIVTLSISIACPYDKAWEYLNDPLNQKEWGVHFFQDVEKIDGHYWATVPFGKFPLALKTNKESGVIDIFMGDGEPIRTRLVKNGDNASMYIFTLPQPKEMPDEVWQNVGLPNMQEELEILKVILEKL